MVRQRLAAARVVTQQIALLAATVFVFDVMMYFALPEYLARYFIGYRQAASTTLPLWDIRYYYFAHPERGHDIASGQSTWDAVQGLRYQIWSNQFGCFDRDWPSVPEGYYYFAGDSFTWGFSPYETKFATLFEKLTGIPSVKCGVLSTGQIHQFSKFLEIANRIGHFPKRVVIGYCVNDIADDFLYPSTTVVSGWLINSVSLDQADRLQRVDSAVLEQRVMENFEAARARQRALTAGLQDWFKRYSLTSHVMVKAMEEARKVLVFRALDPSQHVLNNGAFVLTGQSLFEHVMGRYVRNGRIEYEAAVAEPNKRALAQWHAHAHTNGYLLSVMLIPPRHDFTNERFYDRVKAYLTKLGIDFIDLAKEFRQNRTHVNEAYWIQDGHLTPEGNRVAAEALVQRWPR
jgi:hypothetical protein